MEVSKIVKSWFAIWESGEFHHLPITDDFKHTSPFGTINGKSSYIKLVEENKDKFLGYQFHIHDEIYNDQKACVRYTAYQGEEFQLDVSEWYFFKGELIQEIVAYYHIGEIREERKLNL